MSRYVKVGEQGRLFTLCRMLSSKAGRTYTRNPVRLKGTPARSMPQPAAMVKSIRLDAWATARSVPRTTSSIRRTTAVCPRSCTRVSAFSNMSSWASTADAFSSAAVIFSAEVALKPGQELLYLACCERALQLRCDGGEKRFRTQHLGHPSLKHPQGSRFHSYLCQRLQYSGPANIQYVRQLYPQPRYIEQPLRRIRCTGQAARASSQHGHGTQQHRCQKTTHSTHPGSSCRPPASAFRYNPSAKLRQEGFLSTRSSISNSHCVRSGPLHISSDPVYGRRWKSAGRTRRTGTV